MPGDNSVIITVEFGTNKSISTIFSRLSGTRMELVSKIRVVLWLADKILMLPFIVFAMRCVIPLSFMARGTSVLFLFLLRLRELRSLSKTILNGIDRETYL